MSGTASAAARSPIAIESVDLVKSFRTGQEVVRAVRGASLAVRKGEIVALEGPSGSGKTTLLCLLGCMLSPDSGRLLIDGREIDLNRPRLLPAVRRTSIGFVFQQFNLFPALNVRENVLFALKIKGMTGRPARAEADRMIEAVGLGHRARARPRELSGGQKQRVAIARALAGPSTVLLADEPTANLDVQTGTQILAMFRELARREDRGVVIVTHDPKVRRIADRVCRVSDGVLTEEGAAPEPTPPAPAPAQRPEAPRPATPRPTLIHPGFDLALAELEPARLPAGPADDPRPDDGPAAGLEPGGPPAARRARRGPEALAVAARDRVTAR